MQRIFWCLFLKFLLFIWIPALPDELKRTKKLHGSTDRRAKMGFICSYLMPGHFQPGLKVFLRLLTWNLSHLPPTLNGTSPHCNTSTSSGFYAIFGIFHTLKHGPTTASPWEKWRALMFWNFPQIIYWPQKKEKPFFLRVLLVLLCVLFLDQGTTYSCDLCLCWCLKRHTESFSFF